MSRRHAIRFVQSSVFLLVLLLGCLLPALRPSPSEAASSSSMCFNGNQLVQIPDSPSLDPSEITVACWVNFASLAYNYGPGNAYAQFLLCKGGDRTSGAYRFIQDSVGPGSEKLGFWIGEFWLGYRADSEAPLETNRWYYVAGTYDGQDIKLYLDGSLLASATVGPIPVGNSSPLYFSYNDVSGFPYYLLDGQMDEVRIWSYALNETQIQETMHGHILPNAPGLAGYWRFDEDFSDQNVLDSSPNANNGWLGTSQSPDPYDPTRCQPGVPLDEHSMCFNGNQLVQIPDSPSLNPSEITVECWVNFSRLAPADVPNQTQFLLCKGGDRDAGNYRLMSCGVGNIGTYALVFAIGDISHPNDYALNWAPLQTNQWYYIAGTYDGQEMKLYLDGALLASSTVGSIPVGNDRPLYLSYNDVPGFPYYLKGAMDEVRIWNYARTQTEIQETMYSQPAASAPGLAGYWRFDEDVSDQNVLDSSPNANNGWLGADPSPDASDPTRCPGAPTPNQPQNQLPNQPANSTPANGAASVSMTPTLTSSAFSDPNAGATQAASQWQIATTAGANYAASSDSYSSPVFDSATDTSDLSSITVPTGILNSSSTYYWHVRYEDNNGNWSGYSNETSFTTASGYQVETATSTGTATFYSDNGTIQNLTAVNPATLPAPPVNDLQFPDGLFSFNITGVPVGGTVTVTIQLPSGIPANAGYWKYAFSAWSQIGYTAINAHEIAITLADDGAHGDLVAGDGVINDPGGLGGFGPSGGGATSTPVFPSIYIGIGAALGAGILAYAVRRRFARQ